MLELDHTLGQTLRARGNDDIDSLHGLCTPFVVTRVQIHYADIKTGGGAATTTADVTLSLASDTDDGFDVDLYLIADRGIGADVNLQIDPMLYPAWLFTRDNVNHAPDKLRVSWTNPDPPNIGYCLSVTVVPLREFYRGA